MTCTCCVYAVKQSLSLIWTPLYTRLWVVPLEPLIQVTHCPTSTCLGVLGWIRLTDLNRELSFLWERDRVASYLELYSPSAIARSLRCQKRRDLQSSGAIFPKRLRDLERESPAFSHFSKLATRERHLIGHSGWKCAPFPWKLLGRQQSVNKNRKLWCNKTVISPLVVAVPDLQPLPLAPSRSWL
jgi:hypothetical protein